MSNSPGLFSLRPFRPPHSRTLDINTRICFWHKDLLLLGQGLRLLATGRLAWSSFTARFCLMRELARAAIFCPPHTFGRGVSSFPVLPVLICLFAFLKKTRVGQMFEGNPQRGDWATKWVNSKEFNLTVPLEREDL